MSPLLYFPIGLVILIVLVAVILAIVGQLRVQNYRRAKKTFDQDLLRQEETLMRNQLEPIQLPYQLPDGEDCFFMEENIKVYQCEKRELKHNLMFNSEIARTHDQKYRLFQLSGYLNITSVQAGIAYQGIGYLSNRRIIIDAPKATKTLYYSDILRIAPSIFSQNGIYECGVVVFTKNEIYKIVPENALLGLVAFRLWKQHINHLTLETEVK